MPALQTIYRPKTFDDLFGNKPTITSIMKALQREKPPSAFLLTGPAGTGKTTIARIISLTLKCSKTDFQELNAADDRGIDSVRALIDSMRSAPLSGNRKIILLDEAHALTRPAQEALLKALEEPPDYVNWIICTTNPEQLKDTLKRRCHQYVLHKLFDAEMKQLLKNIIAKEGKKIDTFPPSVIVKLLSVANGSPGQALKIMDQIIDLTDPKAMMSIVESIAYSEDDGDIASLCKILADQKITDEELRWKKMVPILKNLDIDPESGRRVVLSWMSKTLLSTSSARVAGVIHNFSKNFYDSGKAGFDLACYLCCVEMGD